MTPAVFLAFVAVVAAAVVAVVARYLGRRPAAGAGVCLAAWFAYVGLLAWLGVVRDAAARPPGVAFVVGPVVAFLALLVARPPATARAAAAAVPLGLLLGAQCFRVGVELFLHRLWHEGVVPRTLTFAGDNVDIWVGGSAPLVAWLGTRGRPGLRAAVVWNALGLAALANVVARSVLTAPGPLNRVHAELPNLMMTTFPYVLIPGFFVPLAVVLHALAIRSIARRLGGEPAPPKH